MGFLGVIHRADGSNFLVDSVISRINSLDVLTYSQNVNIVYLVKHLALHLGMRRNLPIKGGKAW